MAFFQKIKEGLKKTREGISKQLDNLFSGFRKVDEELFEELEEILVTGDVGIHTSEKICNELRKKVKSENVTNASDVKELFTATVAELLQGENELNLSTKPSVILVIGVNGVGKTTTIGKLAANLRSQGKKVILSAADTFRAAAIEQLEIWAQRSGCDIVKHAEGSDPAAVVYDSIAAAKARNADVVICDTAGRLHNKKHLMAELAKISRIIERELPDADKEVLLVLDATTGQNAINQAIEFKNTAGLTGIVLTKLDGTARGGVVLAIKEELGVPVKYVGVGEQIDDLQPFDPTEFARALFDIKLENDAEQSEEAEN
ncbi:MAG: signal recognition particle-docking protein FtsY [Oscillospiraceae bacterium]|jgi:fused signal recognition particle receptor|nr:signal recognition particle-docking protein FtsY [Oscillospiraceae bacterium]